MRECVLAGFCGCLLSATAGAVEAGGAVSASEFINDPMPTPSCHASTIAQSGGELVAAWFGGAREGAADVGIWVARQEHGVWQPAREVAVGHDAQDVRVPCWNPVLFQQPKGPLLLFYKSSAKINAWEGMLMSSEDDGRSWSKPRRLPNGMLGPIKNKPLLLGDGRLLCGASDELGGWRMHIEWTRDGGATWARTGPLNDGINLHAIQPSFLQHKDGSVQAIGRTRSQRLFSILSKDGGTTWGQMELLEVPNPNSGTDALTLRDGRHLLVYNPVVKGRSPLAVALSRDGREWRDVLTLEDEPQKEFSYPAVIQAADGKVHITYTWKRLKVRHVVLDPAKLP